MLHTGKDSDKQNFTTGFATRPVFCTHGVLNSLISHDVTCFVLE